MTRNRVDRTFDYGMLLKDAGLIAASAAAQVGAVDKIINFGGADVRVDGTVILDVTVIDVANTDEVTVVIAQVSSSATFASAIKNVASLELNALAVQRGGADGGVIGHYELPFTNEFSGTAYRYFRLYTFIGGTNTGINYIAHLGKKA